MLTKGIGCEVATWLSRGCYVSDQVVFHLVQFKHGIKTSLLKKRFPASCLKVDRTRVAVACTVTSHQQLSCFRPVVPVYGSEDSDGCVIGRERMRGLADFFELNEDVSFCQGTVFLGDVQHEHLSRKSAAIKETLEHAVDGRIPSFSFCRMASGKCRFLSKTMAKQSYANIRKVHCCKLCNSINRNGVTIIFLAQKCA